MTPAPCPRLFEVEAMRDGRLAGGERASFERHVAGCAECRREAHALEALAERLRTGTGTREDADELHARRARTRLLAAFDGALVASDERPVLRRALAALLAAALLAVLAVVWRARATTEGVTSPLTRVRPLAASVWSERVENDVDRILLERGSLFIRIDRTSRERRVVVALPDGELEDIGTTFTVSAAGGHTTQVAVESGRVLLRLRGRPTVVLGPGDTWARAARPAASPDTTPGPATSRPEPVPASPAAAASPEPPRVAGEARPATAPTSASAFPAPSPSTSTPPDASADFRAALAALHAGDGRAAAAAFGSFLVRHPGDPRCEDAAYLRVLALQKTGDAAGTRGAALEYLRRYPSGFRRAEVERLAR